MILGVDVYAGDRVDYRALRKLGVRFAYIKVSEGADVDKRCVEHAKGFRGEGIEIGAYAYEYSPRVDQSEAAKVFADVVVEADIRDLRPSVDFESACSASRAICVPLELALVHAEQLALGIEELLDVKSITYTGVGFWNTIPNAEKSIFCARDLWDADYRGQLDAQHLPLRAPSIPRGWQGYVIHQFTNGPPHGLEKLDRNVCADLDAIRWRRTQAWVPPIKAQEILMSPIDPWAK